MQLCTDSRLTCEPQAVNEYDDHRVHRDAGTRLPQSAENGRAVKRSQNGYPRANHRTNPANVHVVAASANQSPKSPCTITICAPFGRIMLPATQSNDRVAVSIASPCRAI